MKISQLDFIRAICVLLVMLCHYNAVWAYAGNLNNIVLSTHIWEVYVGSLACSTFFILSGYCLCEGYIKNKTKDRQTTIKSYYIKRIKRIYPLFYFIYIVFGVYIFFVYHRQPFDAQIPFYRIIYSILGIDSYMLSSTREGNFYKGVGEWFLGTLIFLYALFPLLKFIVKKSLVLFVVFSLSVYILSLIFVPWLTYDSYLSWLGNSTTCPFVRLGEFSLGIFLSYKNFRFSFRSFVLSFCVFIVLDELNFSDIRYQTIKLALLGFVLFNFSYLLASSIKYLDNNIVKFISKYCYVIFLVHHVVVYQILGGVEHVVVGHLLSSLMFVGYCILVFILSYFIDYIFWILTHPKQILQRIPLLKTQYL